MWFTRTQSYTSYVFIEKLKVKAGESGHNTSKEVLWREQCFHHQLTQSSITEVHESGGKK